MNDSPSLGGTGVIRMVYYVKYDNRFKFSIGKWTKYFTIIHPYVTRAHAPSFFVCPVAKYTTANLEKKLDKSLLLEKS